jgi:RND family efflux transporter MFP subunit
MTVSSTPSRRLSVLALSFLFLLPLACAPESDAADGKSKPGKATTVKAESETKLVGIQKILPSKVQDRLPCTTHVEVQHSVDILAEVPGQVVEVPIEEGQLVEKGTILCRLDDSEARLSLESAQNEEKIAKTQIDETLLNAEEASKKIGQAKINLANAKKELERATEGVAEQLTSAIELETAQLAFDKASHELALTEFAARKAELEKVKANNQLEQRVLARKIEERKFGKYTIRAPFRGIVPELKVKGGEWVTNSKVLFQLYDAERLEVNISRPQRQFGLLRTGQAVEIEVDAYPTKRFIAHIHYLSPIVDMQTGSFLVRARIEDPDRKLRPGMFCRADIITRESHEALMIPKVAILYQGELPHAFVVRNGKAHRIEINPGIELKDSLEALNKGGVDDENRFHPGEAVVIKGKEKLVEGDRVEFRVEIPVEDTPTADASDKPASQDPAAQKPVKDSDGE